MFYRYAWDIIFRGTRRSRDAGLRETRNIQARRGAFNEADVCCCKTYRRGVLPATVASLGIEPLGTTICGGNTQDCSAISRCLSHEILPQAVQYSARLHYCIRVCEPSFSLPPCFARLALFHEVCTCSLALCRCRIINTSP
jgi:hypothetical protein